MVKQTIQIFARVKPTKKRYSVTNGANGLRVQIAAICGLVKLSRSRKRGARTLGSGQWLLAESRDRLIYVREPTSGYFVDCEEQGSSLEFVVPRDLADGFINNKRENYNFRFQKVFDQTANQEEIFETIAKPVADNCQINKPPINCSGRPAELPNR
ncbi:kinesin-like protein KIF6 [Rhinichthys klamathensis goyatoka]|uniref:kinesin-like protein KIF6 n=1 Tax=Rhinichthys klamathensis goyatoka TaxID=3034132 RepID=UPI0024B5162D|nr:kinesin-like protein KIF6 [Rhinichthys klamathensis goyatoka]